MADRFAARVLACALASFAAAAAQGRTWIVDAANGPGTHFTDLPAAEAAAAHGDVLRVRPGTYSSLVTSKGIALLGEPRFNVGANVFANAAVEVTALPAGRVFTVRGMTATVGVPLDFTAFLARACRGVVHVHELDANGPLATASAARVDQCDLVTFTDCAPAIAMSMNAIGGVLALVRCRFQGAAALGHPLQGNRTASPALRAGQGAQVFVAECTLSGGLGTSIWPNFGQYHPSAAAVLLTGAALALAAGPTTANAGGGVPTTLPRSAIEGTGSVELDPSVTLSPFAGAPPIAPGIGVALAPLASLTATGGTLGSPTSVTLRSQANDPYVLGAGLATVPIGTPLGLLCLDLNAWFVLAAGNQAANGTTTWSLPLPNDLALAGLGLTFQAASAGTGIRLTNPASVVLR